MAAGVLSLSHYRTKRRRAALSEAGEGRFLEQAPSLLTGVLHGDLAGVNVLVVIGGLVTVEAGNLGDLDVVLQAAFLGVAVAEVQVGNASGLASVNRVGQGDLEGAGGGLLVEAQVADVRTVGGARG